LTNVSFSGNSATSDGGGIYNDTFCRPTIVNSIFWHNVSSGSTTSASASVFNDTSTPTFSYSLIANSGGSDSWDAAIVTDGGDNIYADPLFVTAVDPTMAPTTAGDLRLQSNSPAIDKGNTISYTNPIRDDLAGNPRVVNSVIDMGAYEFGETKIFLPFIAKAGTPDLVVESVTVTGDQAVTVVVRNDGHAAVTDEFWVDLYIGLNDSNTPPTQVNDTWNNISPYGAAWGITSSALPLAPGASLELTIGGAYYDASRSSLPTAIGSGTVLYAHVDSADVSSANGAVLEGHEANGGVYNNIFGPVTR